MLFFDCNTSYGLDSRGALMRPVRTVDDLLREMDSAGVKKAIVSNTQQYMGAFVNGNKMLSDDIKDRENLYGVYTILPSHTHEMPEPEKMLKIMKDNRIIGWRLNPTHARYLPMPFVLKDWFETAVEKNIPVFINSPRIMSAPPYMNDAPGTSLQDLANIMERYPSLSVVLNFEFDWPSDRLLRPFVACFPNLYLDMTYWFADGIIESFVEEYGARRLLYGSGFPQCYFGSNMLMIKHSDISDEDKSLIAGENMMRIIRGVMYD